VPILGKVSFLKAIDKNMYSKTPTTSKSASDEHSDILAPTLNGETSTKKRALSERSSSPDSQRSGRWSPDEKLLFLHGLKVFGKGRWKKIRTFLPTR
jgi:hypothetical protein